MTDRFIAFDIEMPGQREMRISAIGITVIENGEICDKIYYLVNPETKFDPYVIKLIGITPEMVENEPAFPEIWEKIKDVMSSGVLVAHGACGDIKAVCECLKHYGIEWCDKVSYLCTCDIALDCYRCLESHSLDALCEHIGFDLNHHNALSDSEGCARLLLDYMENGVDLEKYLCKFDVNACCKVRKTTARKRKSVEEKIRAALLCAADERLQKSVSARLGLPTESVLGVREDKQRFFANRLIKANKSYEYLKALPHLYLEENNIHAILLSQKRKYSVTVSLIERFLPFVDNEETCALIKPKIFRARQEELTQKIAEWISADHVYTKVFGINMMQEFFLQEEYLEQWFALLCAETSGEQVFKKRKAQFFAKALLAYEEQTVSFLKEEQLDRWTHNMAVQIAAYTKGVDEEKRQTLCALRR